MKCLKNIKSSKTPLTFLKISEIPSNYLKEPLEMPFNKRNLCNNEDLMCVY